MTNLASNSLSVTAETVRDLLLESDALAVKSIDKALEAGRLLVIAKEECKHGEWLPFLDRAGIGERKAQRYMTLARSGVTSVTVSEMGGIRATLEFLSRRERALPTGDRGLIVYGDRDKDIWNAVFLMESSHHRGFYYMAAMNGAHTIFNMRPIAGEPLHIPGEESIYPVWHWIERQFLAPPAGWKVEECGVGVVALLFTFIDLDHSITEQSDLLNFANVAGLRQLKEQVDAICGDPAEDCQPDEPGGGEAERAAEELATFRQRIASFSPEMRRAMLESLAA
jgi:hypothetical protein